MRLTSLQEILVSPQHLSLLKDMLYTTTSARTRVD